MTIATNPADERGQRPVPDPTLLTTEALLREILHLRELIQEKLDRLEDLGRKQFEGVDERLRVTEDLRKEQKADTEKAILAALESQETAAAKSEHAISKQLEQMQTTFKAGLENLSLGVGDVKERVTRMEAVKLGGTESRAGLYAAVAVIGTVILAVLAIVAFIAP